MAHVNPVTTATIHSQAIQNAPGDMFTSTLVMRNASVPHINSDEHSGWDDDPYDDWCTQYWNRKEEESKKQVCLPQPPPFFDPSHQYVPAIVPEQWKKCHLLSLPRDIRLRVYEYALTDPTNPQLLVGIDRQPSCPSYKVIRPPAPELSFFHVKRRNPIAVNLLQTNRTIYGEALPVLYRDAKFMPSDLEGLLPIFLNTLSPFARSCIRSIYLCIPKQVSTSTATTFHTDRSKPFFHWAVTCAQVAQLNDTLQCVEIDGEWSVFQRLGNRRSILFPLCKIKAPKKFVPCGLSEDDPDDYDAAFQELLVEAGQGLKASAKLREERTKAEAIERAKQDKLRKEREQEAEEIRRKNHRDHWLLERRHTSLVSCFKSPLEEEDNGIPAISELGEVTMADWCRFAEENLKRMEQDLSRVPGIKQFEKELEAHALPNNTPGEVPSLSQDDVELPEDWDLISIRSAASTPKARPASVVSKYSDETFLDTASTLVGDDDVKKDGVDKGQDSDAESETWEHIER